MFGNVITLLINLLSAIQWIEKDEELQRKILEIARDQINLALKPKPTIADLRSVYEQQGKIPAINDCPIGRRVTVHLPESKWNGLVGHIAREADGGFYISTKDRASELFFRSECLLFG